MKKHLIAVLAALTLCICIMPTAVFADTVASGTCGGEDDGSNLTWILTDDGTLTISGAGAMKNWNSTLPAPWANYIGDITTVKIGDNVTYIGIEAFNGCGNLTESVICSGVTDIGNLAFCGCNKLRRVTHQGNFFWQTTGETRFDDYNRHTVIVWTVRM